MLTELIHTISLCSSCTCQAFSCSLATVDSISTIAWFTLSIPLFLFGRPVLFSMLRVLRGKHTPSIYIGLAVLFIFGHTSSTNTPHIDVPFKDICWPYRWPRTLEQSRRTFQATADKAREGGNTRSELKYWTETITDERLENGRDVNGPTHCRARSFRT